MENPKSAPHGGMDISPIKPWGHQRTEMSVSTHWFLVVASKIQPIFPNKMNLDLVGGFNPIKQNSQSESFAQVGVKIKHIWNHYLMVSGSLVLKPNPLMDPSQRIGGKIENQCTSVRSDCSSPRATCAQRSKASKVPEDSFSSKSPIEMFLNLVGIQWKIFEPKRMV